MLHRILIIFILSFILIYQLKSVSADNTESYIQPTSSIIINKGPNIPHNTIKETPSFISSSITIQAHQAANNNIKTSSSNPFIPIISNGPTTTTVNTSPTTTESIFTSSNKPSDASIASTNSNTNININMPTVSPISSITLLGPANITYPTDSAVFSVTVDPPQSTNSYNISCSQLSGPSLSEIAIQTEDYSNITLHDLIPGIYTYLVNITNTMGFVKLEYFNLTVILPNSPPVVYIEPQFVILTPPTSSIAFDASLSSDDKPLINANYIWSIVSAPESIFSSLKNNKFTGSTVVIDGLTVEGNYTIMLSVTDSDGALSTKSVEVNVKPETDYPPTAVLGDARQVQLPISEVIIDGSRSNDDHGIVKFEWEKFDGPTVDMTGTGTSNLHLTNLSPGNYQFGLTVTDKLEQSSSSRITLEVLPIDNYPPIAHIDSTNLIITSPKDSIILSAAQSTDDKSITGYYWQQIDGPTDIILNGEDSVNLTVEHLHVTKTSNPTLYTFSVTVSDAEGLNSSCVVIVTMQQKINQPPIAIIKEKTSSPFILELPVHFLTLDASDSHDDSGELLFNWFKTKTSPALGEALYNSQTQSILYLSNLVQGNYTFILEVSDLMKSTAVNSIDIHVIEDPYKQYTFVIKLRIPQYQFSSGISSKILSNLNNLFGEDYAFELRKISGDELYFYLHVNAFKQGKLVYAYDIVSQIAPREYTQISNITIISINTLLCQNPCSGHGICDLYTKQCVCDKYWMPDVFKNKQGLSNCDWSVLYVGISLLTIATVCILACVVCGWFICYSYSKRTSIPSKFLTIKKKKGSWVKTKINYAIIDSDEDFNHGMVKLSSQIPMTEISKSDSEEETSALHNRDTETKMH